MTRKISPIEQSNAWSSYYRNRDKSSRAILIESYFYLCLIAADKFEWMLPDNSDKYDLAIEGMSGLISAIETYTRERHTLFTTYAKPCIRNAILDYIRVADWVPRNLRELAEQVTAWEDSLDCAGCDVTDEMVLSQFGIRPSRLAEVRRLQRDNGFLLSLTDAYLTDNEGNSIALIDAIKSDLPLPEDTTMQTAIIAVLMEEIANLSIRQRYIISRKYWFGETNAEIANGLKVTPVIVKQNHMKALKALRLQIIEVLK